MKRVNPRAGVGLTAFLAGLVFSAPGSLPAQEQWRTDFGKHTVPLDEIVSGGPSKDGIPSIDDPKFESVKVADRWLDDREPVVTVQLDGIAKAYPLSILIYHEIVNDVVGTTPVSVTYCPLCNTALAFDRRFDNTVLDFGTTGRLRHSDLVMYDRQTESWWQQATGEGIVGQYAGESLTLISAPLVSWKTFKERFPEGQVLSRNTGFTRLQQYYGQNPYEGYDRKRSPIREFFRPTPDNRLPAMERVVAVEHSGENIAFAFSALKKNKVMSDRVGGTAIVVFWAPGTASAVDNRVIADGRDVGSSGVFNPSLDGRLLSFEASSEGEFTDRETASTWNILGQAVSGPLAGKQLAPIAHGNHFWFAWGAFRPETRVIR